MRDIFSSCSGWAIKQCDLHARRPLGDSPCKRGNFCPNRRSLRVGAFCAEVVIPNYVCRWHVTWSINAETGEVVSPLFSTNAADSLPKRDEKKRQQSQENELNRD
jgi:hypothetical protein